MGCDGNNATPPSPGIAPGGEDINARAAAERIGRICHQQGHLDPRLPALAPGFDAPFFQAGLAGYSDPAMRIIARRHGCPLCVTEALLDRTLLAGGRGFAKADLGDIAENVPGGADDHPLVGQIMGTEPGSMAAAALKMVEQGARTSAHYQALASTPDQATEPGPRPDRATADPAHPGGAGFQPARAPGHTPEATSPTFATIDVNLACPVKKVARKARGGHFLAEPEAAIAILEAVRDAVPDHIPMTVKMRRGYDDTPEMARNFWRIFDAAYDIGCAWVTVHGRTVSQKYVGPSRWDLIRDIVRARPDRLIFGSGDIWDAGEIFRMIEYTGVRAVSVARGCIGNPWIFRQARDMMAGRPPEPPTLDEQRDVLEQHFELALRLNRTRRDPEGHTAREMRKFGIRFSAHHPEAETVRRRFIEAGSLADWRAVLEAHYAQPAPFGPC